jgi:non-specific serine/threonine protein kinase
MWRFCAGLPARRLHDRFRLLTGGSRTAAARHQTLRATVDWSYDLLDTSEKALFRRLSVFTGSWRLASAEAVCDGAGADLDVPDLVLRLVDKSLVAVEGEVRSRYRLLETLRQYGLERLEEAGEKAEFERRHAEHFLALTLSEDWPTQTWWLDTRLQMAAPELDNLRAALEWSRTQPADVQLSLVIRVAPLWMAQGRFAEGAHALQAALDRSHQPTMLRLQALERLGWLAIQHGDLSSAAAAVEEMLEFSDHTGGTGRAMALALTGYVAMQTGDLARASDSAASDGQYTRAVILTQVAVRLLGETGWDDAHLLDWFRRTLRPAFETLGKDAAAHARAKGDLMTVGEAFDYAAGGYDDLPRGTPARSPLGQAKDVNARRGSDPKRWPVSPGRAILEVSYHVTCNLAHDCGRPGRGSIVP